MTTSYFLVFFLVFNKQNCQYFKFLSIVLTIWHLSFLQAPAFHPRDLKSIRSTYPFLHSLSSSIWTACLYGFGIRERRTYWALAFVIASWTLLSAFQFTLNSLKCLSYHIADNLTELAELRSTTSSLRGVNPAWDRGTRPPNFEWGDGNTSCPPKYGAYSALVSAGQ